MKKKYLLVLLTLVFTISLYAEVEITKDYYTIDGHKMYFCEAGDYNEDNAILLLHGLMANKEQWQQMMKYFASRGYYVVALDLPGYGESSEFPLTDYILKNQVELLHKFIKRLDLKKINLAGNSLGCALALIYAEKYSGEIKTLALLGGPAGLARWSPEILDEFEKGINPFIPTTIEEFYKEIDLLFYKAPEIPQEVAAKMVSGYTTNKKRFNYIYNVFSVSMYNFAVNFSVDFSIPTLIIWGYDDKVFTVKDAVKAQEKIPGSKLVILKKAGHLIMVENSQQVSREYFNFLKKN